MLNKRLLLSIIFMVGVGAYELVPTRAAETQAAAKLTILQINDSHAYFEPHQEAFAGPDGLVYREAGGYARMAGLVKAIRRETGGHVFFGDSGDTFFGTYPAAKSRGGVMPPILNAMGIDAMTPHWEFVFGPKRFQELARQLNYPVLAINIYDKASGQRVFPPYLIKEVGGLKLGVIGIGSNIVDKSMPPAYSEGLRFSLGREELPDVIREVRQKERANLVIVISHLGFPQDMKLLSEVPGVDVCLSGHTHNRLYEPALAGKTIVIQSGSHSAFVGRLDLTTQAGQISGYKYRLIEVSSDLTPDPEVESVIQKELAPYKHELAEVVGETGTALNRNTMLEATMDNLLLDALLEATGAQIAFSNGWRWGAPVVPGKITLNDLYNMIVVNPPVSTVELSGRDLVAMLEENYERTFSSDAFEQMGGYAKRCAGITVRIKVENPKGTRIQTLFVGKEEVQPDKVYKAAYVTQQGVPAKYGRNHQRLPKDAVTALREYLAHHKPARSDLRGSVIVE